MKASLKNYAQSPRKVRLVTDAVKGKSADKALLILENLPKRASQPIMKLLKSALANAGGNPTEYIIKDARVDEGVTLKRIRPAAKGSAHLIRKRTSHVTLALDSKGK